MSANTALGFSGGTPIVYQGVTGTWLKITNTSTINLNLKNIFGLDLIIAPGDQFTDLFPATIVTDLASAGIPYVTPTVQTVTNNQIQAVEHGAYFVDTTGGVVSINLPTSFTPNGIIQASNPPNGFFPQGILEDSVYPQAHVAGAGWTEFSVVDVAGDFGTNSVYIVDNSGEFGIGTGLPSYNQTNVSSATYTSSTGILAVTFGSAPLGSSIGSSADGFALTLAGLTTSAGSASAVNGTFPIVSTASSGTVINLQLATGLGTITINSATGHLVAGGGGGNTIALTNNYGGYRVINLNSISEPFQQAAIGSLMNVGSYGGNIPGGTYTTPMPKTGRMVQDEVDAANFNEGYVGFAPIRVGKLLVIPFNWLPNLQYLLGNNFIPPQVPKTGAPDGGIEGSAALPMKAAQFATQLAPIYTLTGGAIAQPGYNPYSAPVPATSIASSLTTDNPAATAFVTGTPPKNIPSISSLYPAIPRQAASISSPVTNGSTNI